MARTTRAGLSRLNLSPERGDKMLANVSPALSGAPERSSPLSRAQTKQTQACTKASHKPQPTSQFPLWGFFSPSDIHKHIYIYIGEQKENVHAAEYSKKETVFTILSNFSGVPEELLFPQLPPERSLPACSGAPVRVSCTGGGQTG